MAVDQATRQSALVFFNGAENITTVSRELAVSRALGFINSNVAKMWAHEKC